MQVKIHVDFCLDVMILLPTVCTKHFTPLGYRTVVALYLILFVEIKESLSKNEYSTCVPDIIHGRCCHYNKPKTCISITAIAVKNNNRTTRDDEV